MKEPRFQMTIEVSYNEYLGLMLAIGGRHLGRPDKQTVKKIARFQNKFRAAHDAWRKTQFKCAGKIDPAR